MKTANKLLMAGCALLALSAFSHASCANNTPGSPATRTIVQEKTSISVPRNSFNVGDVIFTSHRYYNDDADYVSTCTNTANDYEWGYITGGPLASASRASISPSPGYPPPSKVIYNTNVPGIGIALYYYDEAMSPLSSPRWPLYTNGDMNRWKSLASFNGWVFYQSGDFQFELIKTGNVSAGLLNLAGTTASVWLGGSAPGAPGSVNTANMIIPFNIAITTTTCNIPTPYITVPLPKVSVSALPGPDTAAGMTAFDINLTCSDGRVSFMVDANQYSAGYYSLIVPEAISTAKGVTVQLLDRSTNPWAGIYLNGGKSFLADTTGQSNVPLTIKLAARYYRPNSVPAVALVPGTVIAKAYLNLNYE